MSIVKYLADFLSQSGANELNNESVFLNLLKGWKKCFFCSEFIAPALPQFHLVSSLREFGISTVSKFGEVVKIENNIYQNCTKPKRGRIE